MSDTGEACCKITSGRLKGVHASGAADKMQRSFKYFHAVQISTCNLFPVRHGEFDDLIRLNNQSHKQPSFVV